MHPLGRFALSLLTFVASTHGALAQSSSVATERDTPRTGWRFATIDVLAGGYNANPGSYTDFGFGLEQRRSWGAGGAVRAAVPVARRLAVTVHVSTAATPTLMEQRSVAVLGEVPARNLVRGYDARWLDATLGLEWRAPLRRDLALLLGAEAGYGRVDEQRSSCTIEGGAIGTPPSPCEGPFATRGAAPVRLHGILLAANAGVAWRVAPRLQLLGVVRPTLVRAYGALPRPWTAQVGVRLGR